MIFFIVLLLSIIQIVELLVVGNKTVVCSGGPGTYTDVDRYNKIGSWNQTFHPADPQQIHVSWISDGKAFTVQFSTMESIQKTRLFYWSNDGEEDEMVQESEVIKKKRKTHVLQKSLIKK